MPGVPRSQTPSSRGSLTVNLRLGVSVRDTGRTGIEEGMLSNRSTAGFLVMTNQPIRSLVPYMIP